MESDRLRLRQMMGARAAGVSLRRFLDMDALECDYWMDYALTGPTEARTQMLLAQLIQTVQGALGGNPAPLDKLIPWFSVLSGKTPQDALKMKLDKQRSIDLAMLDDAERKLKGTSNGT